MKIIVRSSGTQWSLLQQWYMLLLALAIIATVVIGNPERHMRKASHCGSKQQLSSHAMITLLLLVRARYMYGVVLHAHPVRGESHNQRNNTGEVATLLFSFAVAKICVSLL